MVPTDWCSSDWNVIVCVVVGGVCYIVFCPSVVQCLCLAVVSLWRLSMLLQASTTDGKTVAVRVLVSGDFIERLTWWMR